MSSTHPTILVTGGTGFLGSEIVRLLVDSRTPYNIVALDINPPSLGTQSFPSKVTYIRANVLSPSELKAAFEEHRPSLIIHTVGLYTTGPARYNTLAKARIFEINVTGTQNVLTAAQACKARGLVYTSSFAVIVDELDKDFPNVDESYPTGHAALSYGQSKTAAEKHVLAANSATFKTCSLRPSVIFGPNDPSCIPIIAALIPAGQTPVIIGDGKNLSDFVYVEDVARAHVLAAENLLSESASAGGEVFFIGSDSPVAFRDFCLAVWKELGHVPAFSIPVPVELMWFVALVMEWLFWLVGMGGKEILNRGMVRDASATRYVNIAKARRVLGYRPRIALQDGIRRAAEEYQCRASGKYGKKVE